MTPSSIVHQASEDQTHASMVACASASLDCSMCHDNDGQAQNPPGRWMYPRAADLTSNRVQSYSDEELFWIIQNGIRLTGMPAFGRAESADHIWDLVNYVRTLPGGLTSEDSTKWPRKEINSIQISE